MSNGRGSQRSGRHQGQRAWSPTADGGQELGLAPPAELAGEQGADNDGGRNRQGRPQAQTGKRDSEDPQSDPGQKWSEDRLVHVATLQMAGGVQEVQLVAVKAVEAG